MTENAHSMRKRLLLVDDESHNLDLLESNLAPLGHELVRAKDGPSAIAVFAAGRPDLVVLDLSMPGLDGLDVLSHIRAHEQGDHVPVVVLTAHSEPEFRLRALELRADDFLEKPLHGPLLRVRVGTLLEFKESRDALRRLNSELASRNQSLERVQQEQRELTGFVVHDLKNPLAAVVMNVEFARDQSQQDSELRRALDEAVNASRRLRHMIEDLLMISQLEESVLPLSPEPIRLTDFLREVFREYVRQAQERHVTLLGPGVSDAQVLADRSLLQRVLENILDNSLRYTPEDGRVGLTTHVNGSVEIAVSNTGPSIPLSERQRIFEKFARIERTGGGRSNAGLGLYFCKRAVEALGGNIEVTETPEWPTSFVLRFPSVPSP
jgi:two-component system sensor histidine kinase/response regulator